jgi:hypothetical protein
MTRQTKKEDKKHANKLVLLSCVQVFELTKGQHLSLETAEQLMTQLEQESQQMQGTTSPTAEAPAANTNGSANANAISSANAAYSEAEEEPMEAPEQLLQLLAVSEGLPELRSSADTAAHAAQAAASAAAARQRAYNQVLGAFAVLLKSVANAAACGPGVWGLLGRLYGLQGQLLSSQEAWLKQVRPDLYSCAVFACRKRCSLDEQL